MTRGPWRPRATPRTLGDITAAIDVIEAAKLLRGAIVGDTRNVIAIGSPTPVRRDDEDDGL